MITRLDIPGPSYSSRKPDVPGRFRPQFGLRTLLTVVTLFTVVFWILYVHHWISQRHTFLQDGEVFSASESYVSPPSLAWYLSMFGEEAQILITVPEQKMERARALFPEAQVFMR
jgi:hypothetical protein